MKIKRPSLKGIKNTKYLGHFAQDKYIQQGHNFSGSYPLFKQQSEIEKAGASNPFDVQAERASRQSMIDQKVAELRAQTPDLTPEMQRIQSLDNTAAGRAMKATALPALQQSSVDQVVQNYLGTKKFLSDI